MEPSAHPHGVQPPSLAKRWRRLQDALLATVSAPFQEENKAVDQLLRTCAEALQVGRVGLWLFDPGMAGIVCSVLFEVEKGTSSPGLRISADLAPLYFESLSKSLVLAADNAQLDSRTSELAETYLRPLGIGAMLDVPVRLFGEMVGILCHEHIGEKRRWAAVERVFAAAVGAVCSQTMEFERLRQSEVARDRALFYDRLTGLPNRALFLDRLSQVARGSDAALLVVDIDNFSDIAEAYGTSVGDAVLRTVGGRLSSIAGDEYTSRIGNDEFSVLFVGKQTDTGARERAQEVLASLSETMTLGGQQLCANFNIGCLRSVRGYEWAADALNDAVIAQNSAARGGRHQNIVEFRKGMNATIRTKLALEADMRRAVAAAEFCFHLQPIFSTRGALVGAEALLRWRHPERGLLMPGDFLLVAEHVGLLPEMQFPLIQPLLEQVAVWRSGAYPEFEMALNISPSQLALFPFPDALLSLVAAAGVPARAVAIEITENTLLSSEDRNSDAIGRIASRGVHVSLDDFGTGFASITHLVELPLAAVKLDKIFVARATGDKRYASAVRGLVNMAHELSLCVTAEGVETVAQKDFLTECGCDRLQGYLLGKPVPMEAFCDLWMP